MKSEFWSEHDRELDRLALRAFRDAVRDIVADQGSFELALTTGPEAAIAWCVGRPACA